MTDPRVPKTFRLPLSLVRELEVRAELDGVPQTRIVEHAVRGALAAAGEGSGGGTSAGEPPTGDGRAAPDASALHQPPGDLVGFVSKNAGVPRSLARMFIEQGRVYVDGGVCSDPEVERSQLNTVELDGNALNG